MDHRDRGSTFRKLALVCLLCVALILSVAAVVTRSFPVAWGGGPSGG